MTEPAMAEPTSTSELERRYRKLLRILPGYYRAAWQEDMVTSFLASMQSDDPDQNDYLADYGRPSWSEVASVVTLAVHLRLPGVHTRLGGAGAPPRNVVWGDAVRLVALVGLLLHAASAAVNLGLMLWISNLVPTVPQAPAEWHAALPTETWQSVTVVAHVLWLPTYLALLSGQTAVARLLAALALGSTVLANALRFDPSAPFALSDVAFLAFAAVPVLALVAFHREAPPVRWRPWLAALPVAIAVEVTMLVTQPDYLAVLPLLDWPATMCLALVTAALVQLAIPRRTPAWSLALALLGVAVFGLRVMTMMVYAKAAPDTQRGTLMVLGPIEAVAVAAATVFLAIVASRALSRLPAAARPA